MEDEEIRAKISPKKYVIKAISAIIFDGLLFWLLFWITNQPILNPPHAKNMPRPSTPYDGMMYLGMIIAMIIIPAYVVFTINKAVIVFQLKKHVKYIKAINPEIDFNNLKSKDIDRIDAQLSFLKDIRSGNLFDGRFTSTTLNSLPDRNQFFEEHKNELMELHPEFDFYNLSKKEWDVLNDELDAMMYADKDKDIAFEMLSQIRNRKR